jgi:Transcriptional regulatory protein, C terminal
MRPNTRILQTAAHLDGTFPRRAPPLTDDASTPLEGEHIETTDWEDARHWMSIYGDLLEFKRGVLDRIRIDMAKLPPAARKAAEQDFHLIAGQREGYQKRLELWNRRLRELNGLRLDPKGRMIRYRDREAALTIREFQLLGFLLDHPYRFFTVAEILDEAWSEPNLFPEEVRNYVRRLRKVIAALQIPCNVVNRPGRGYSLEFRGDK